MPRFGLMAHLDSANGDHVDQVSRQYRTWPVLAGYCFTPRLCRLKREIIMDAFFKFLGEQPIVLVVLLVLIVMLFIVVVWATVLATKRGSDISIFGFRIRGTRLAGVSSNLKIELGSEEMSNHAHFYENVQKTKRTCPASVQFKHTFKTT